MPLPDDTCLQFESDMVEFVAGNVSSTRRLQILEHLAHCESCRTCADEITAGLAVVRRAFGTLDRKILMQPAPHDGRVSKSRFITRITMRHFRNAYDVLLTVALFLVPLWVHGYVQTVDVAAQARGRSIEQIEWTPASVALSTDRQIVSLLGRNGKTIHAWATPAPYGFGDAVFVSSADNNGKGSLAILGFGPTNNNEHAGQFVAYDVDHDPDKPVWTLSLPDNEIPEDLRSRPGREYHGNQFSARVCRVADVLPDRPGKELIVVFQHGKFSQCSLRIYDLQGTMLSQAWHDGNISDMYWMSGPKQLVCLGVNSEVDAIDRGLPNWTRKHSIVLYALRPVQGQTESRWIDTVDHAGGIRPIWYRCLLNFPDPTGNGRFEFNEPFPGFDLDSNVGASFFVPTPTGTATLGFTIDQSGNIIRNTFSPNSIFNRAAPDLTTIQFGDLPPIRDRDGVWLPGTPRSADVPHPDGSQ